MLKASLVYSSP